MVHDPHDDFAGTTFGKGRYRTLRRIGGGGMAVVHEAHDRALDRLVAVKRLRPDLAEDAVARSRFAREAQHAAALVHPAIVRVYDTGEDHGPDGPVPWIVMELVRGHTLRALLRRHGGPLSWRRALRIVAPVLDALEHSHARGIVHRDIKPVNVMVTEGGLVKVMDFGIARVLDGGVAPLTAAGHIMGTPQYFSPEQALGQPASPRSDVYSVGCLLFELLVGTVPFDGDSAITVASKHVRDDPLPPSAYRDVPGAVDDLVLHALRKDPHLRFASAAEMRAAVGRILPEALSAQEPGRTSGGVPGNAPGNTRRNSRSRTPSRTRAEAGTDTRRGPAEPRGGRASRRRSRARGRGAWSVVVIVTLLLAAVLAAALR